MKPGSTTNGSSHGDGRSTGTTAGGRSARGGSSRGEGGDGEVARWFSESVCAFWLGEQCFGVVSSLVGEVFLVEACAPVPLAPPSVLGLFNLRGTPVALVDLAMVLDLPGAGEAELAEGATALALVLRTTGLLVGVRIRKMEVVVANGRGLYTPPDGSADEHPVVAGFLELPDRPDLTITLLHPEALVARLDRLRYLEAEEAS
jgi:purine-binding chemotaxis protein CheW